MTDKNPSVEAMRVVSDIRRIDCYGDNSVIASLTYSEAASLIDALIAERTAALTAENARLREALEDVMRQFTAYEEDGKKLRGATIYLDTTKLRAALEVKP